VSQGGRMVLAIRPGMGAAAVGEKKAGACERQGYHEGEECLDCVSG